MGRASRLLIAFVCLACLEQVAVVSGKKHKLLSVQNVAAAVSVFRQAGVSPAE